MGFQPQCRFPNAGNSEDESVNRNVSVQVVFLLNPPSSWNWYRNCLERLSQLRSQIWRTGGDLCLKVTLCVDDFRAMSFLFKIPGVLGVLFAFLLETGVLAHTPGVTAVDSDFLHRIWQFEDGLPQNSVQAVTQTHDGYLWVATQKGLARFDGVEFLTFGPQTTPEIQSWNFTALRETRDGSLWIGTEGGGLNRLQNGKFHAYTTNNGLCGNVIRSLCETKDGRLWIGTTTGISIYQDGKFTEFQHPQWPNNVAVRSILEDRNGNVWIAGGVGLHCFSEGKLATYALPDLPENVVANTMRTLHEDREGRLWVGSSMGASVWKDRARLADYQKQAGLPDPIVTAIFEDRSGNVWIGTYGGLSCLANGKLTVTLNADGSPFDQINSISEDHEGNIWVGSKEGLSQLRTRAVKAFTRQQGLRHNNVMALAESKDGSVWAATWGGGADRIKDGKVIGGINWETFPGEPGRLQFKSEKFLSITEGRDGSIWFGLDFDGGFGRWQDGRIRIYAAGEGLADAAVRALHEDHNGNLWIATRRSPYQLKDDVLTRLAISNGWTGEIIRVITEDAAETLWFGTSGGLTSLKDGKYLTYTAKEGLPANPIATVRADSEGNIWVGTVGGGLARFKDGQARTYTTAHGLFSDDAFEILDDGLGYLWMTCRFGIYRVKKSDFNALDRGEIKQLTSISYGKHEGLMSLECNLVGRPGGIKTRDGRLWFATTKGIAIVDPKSSIKINNIIPPVVIHQVVADKKTIVVPGSKVNSTSSSEPETLTLPPGRGELEVHYTALSFTVPEKNRFKYKLEGFDEDWVDAGTRRAAYFSRLKPGNYRFRVIACNNDGVWNDAGASLSFYLKPHFYETAWFYFVGVAFMGTTVFGVYGWNVRKLQLRQKELETVVADRTKHLKNEIAERVRMEAEMVEVHRQLLDTSRKAGMAEVATSVLHNVGNVLNSVNVSTTLVIEQVHNWRFENLKKVGALIRENSGNLPEFFSNDPRGKHVPDYLSQLSDQLSAKQTVTESELRCLRKNVDHIKDIVAMQQSLAKVGGVIESVPMSSLVKDALLLAHINRHQGGIQIRSEFVDDPVVTTDKHQVLQILVNLIRNAKFACDESDKADKHILLQTRLNGSHVQFVVRDNGVGIPAENLIRIFFHGFTTRKTGNGFGLHSSALSAKGLNGSLTVHSDGVGCGATFTLEIPLENKAKDRST
jgi:ligand-binding sensor domain-containing protein/signal transduction histidine kinase